MTLDPDTVRECRAALADALAREQIAEQHGDEPVPERYHAHVARHYEQIIADAVEREPCDELDSWRHYAALEEGDRAYDRMVEG